MVLVVGGDGRYMNMDTIKIIIRMAAANGFKGVHVGKNGFMSTPAVSAYIRQLARDNVDCIGGMVLTASHNPGGPTEDFGIKFNDNSGGAAQEFMTNKVQISLIFL